MFCFVLSKYALMEMGLYFLDRPLGMVTDIHLKRCEEVLLELLDNLKSNEETDSWRRPCGPTAVHSFVDLISFILCLYGLNGMENPCLYWMKYPSTSTCGKKRQVMILTLLGNLVFSFTRYTLQTMLKWFVDVSLTAKT